MKVRFVVTERRQNGRLVSKYPFDNEAEAMQFYNDEKHGWSDFNVTEVDSDGKIIRMVAFENAHLCG